MNLEKRFLNELNDFLHQERGRCHQVFHALQKIDRPFLLRNEIQNCFESLCRDDAAETLENTPLAKVIAQTQDAVVRSPWLCFATRPQVGQWRYLQFDMETMTVSLISASEFLQLKERLLDGDGAGEKWMLEFDIEPFTRDVPKLR